MPARVRSLGAFYYGPVSIAHREVANGTMEDSSNVLLLKPARPDSGFALKSARPAYGTHETAKRMVTATTYSIGTLRAVFEAGADECRCRNLGLFRNGEQRK
jgi:hypothetical protein